MKPLIAFVALLSACASAPAAKTPSKPAKPRTTIVLAPDEEKIPSGVLANREVMRRTGGPVPTIAALSAAAAVYTGTDCADLTKADGRGNGVFVGPETLATVWHLRQTPAPDVLNDRFAVVTTDGCMDAVIQSERLKRLDLMLLRVPGRKGPFVQMAEGPPKPGDKLRSLRAAGTNPSDPVSARFLRESGETFLEREHLALPAPPEFAGIEFMPSFAAVPRMDDGDSGSPIYDQAGRVTGLLTGNVRPPPRSDIVPRAIYSAGWLIGMLLADPAYGEDPAGAPNP